MGVATTEEPRHIDVSGVVASLVVKLEHALPRIRGRALANLRFKVREGLVDVATQPPHVVEALARALLRCLDDDTELEVNALHILQELLLHKECNEEARLAFRRQLQRHGAAAVFQRGASNAQPELRSIYDSLLQTLLTTVSGSATPATVPAATSRALHMSSASVSSSSQASSVIKDEHANMASSHASLLARSSTSVELIRPHLDSLAAGGWRFPPVTLASMDEQYLFEFEVKMRLRTTIPELVEMTDTFRRELLRDFPPELFLDRPAIVLCLLQLVQQPLLPPNGDPKELSFGANYFDEVSSESYTWKPSTQATAVHVSALKAIEALLSALRHTFQVSLNPIYHVYTPGREEYDIYLAPLHDNKRFLYPRVVGAGGDEAPTDGFSLGGVAYQLIVGLLPLLQVEYYPRLHLIEIIRQAIDLLPEQGLRGRSDDTAVHPLDVERVSVIFQGLAGVCDQLDDKNTENPEKFATLELLSWRIVEVTHKLLEMNPPSVYKPDATHRDPTSGFIAIPSALWRFVLKTVALKVSLSGDESGAKENEILACLEQFDSSALTTVAAIREAQHESTRLRAFFGITKRHDSNSDNAGGVDPSNDDLELALLAVQVIPSLPEEYRITATRAVVNSIRNLLTRDHRGISPEEGSLVQHIVCSSLALAWGESPHAREFSYHVLDCLLDASDHANANDSSDSLRRQRFRGKLIHYMITSELFLQQLLIILAQGDCDSTRNGSRDVYWRWLVVLLESQHDSEPQAFIETSMVPLLQHFAYADPVAIGVPSSFRSVKRTLVHWINRIEQKATIIEKLLLICRCLLHRSSYLRKAAAAGLFDTLSHLTSPQRMEMVSQSAFRNDPFGHFDSSIDSAIRVVENELASFILPQVANSAQNTHVGSSKLLRVSKLRRLLSALKASDASVVESSLQQVELELSTASATEWSILEDAGEVDATVKLIFSGLQELHSSDSEKRKLCGPLLSVLRMVLNNSAEWRERVRRSAAHLTALLPFVFDQSTVVRAAMYFILLSLTCTVEMFASSHEESRRARVPMEMASTFGLFSERWPLYGVETCSLSILAKRSDSSRPSAHVPTQLKDQAQKLSLGEISALAWNRVVRATSYRSFLDVLYQLLAMSISSRRIRRHVIDHYAHDLIKYLQTPPTSAKDEVVLASLLSLLNVVLVDMDRSQLLEVVRLVTRSVLPLLRSGRRSKGNMHSSVLATQLVRLLLHLSESRLSDVVEALVMDSQVLSLLTETLISSATSDALLNSLSMELLLRVVRLYSSRGSLSEDQTSKIQSIIPPLLTHVCRHRVPVCDNSAVEPYLGSVLAAWQLQEGENDGYRSLVELLSLRRAMESYKAHCSRYLAISIDDTIWFRSILTPALHTIVEVARLIQKLLNQVSGLVPFLTKNTVIIPHLVELTVDLAYSLEGIQPQHIDTLQHKLHYVALEEVAKLFSILLAAQGSSSKTVVLSVQPEARLEFSRVTSALMAPSHPTRFQLSFARLVSVVMCNGFFDSSSPSPTSTPLAVVSLALNLWTIYKHAAETQPMTPVVLTEAANQDEVSMQNVERAAIALQVVLARSPAARQEMVRRRCVQTLVSSIRNSFVAMRMSGGFGTKSNRQHEAFQLELCRAVELHCQVLSGLVYDDQDGQKAASAEDLVGVLSANWALMRMAFRRGSRVMCMALRVIQNYLSGSDAAKASLASVSVKVARKGTEVEKSLLTLIVQQTFPSAAVGPTAPAIDPLWRSLGCSILKTALLNLECLLSATKNGLISKFLGLAIEKCQAKVKKPTREGASDDAEDQFLADLLGVLASVASSDEGNQVIMQARELRELVADILTLSGPSSCSQVAITGTLFLRNMTLSKFAKTHFSVWEATLDQLITTMQHQDAIILHDHLSTALWALVFDNQRAQTILSSKPAFMNGLRNLQHTWRLRSAGSDDASLEVYANIERIMQLLTTADPAK
ncbi:hypothetical protein Poli38472_003605 [Pythium oligandrum]|uniref:Rotatin N-terminal domain-containing protein n=1 Tax=Pythium oligandrum TaxID=41045 RepID=A0A8K1CNH4_PYTOL|nr:hypothetical protein Poli38472_003605 [Pythium oligandrum]|eukprot:TMW65840.1 hypothetical protein Poli38472_003605 [Pythium oligandrum]